MIAHLWTLPDCPQCDQAKAALFGAGICFSEAPIDDLVEGVVRNDDALAQLAYQGMAAPVVCVGGNFVEPQYLDEFLESIGGTL